MSTQRFQILLAAICMLVNLMSFCYAQAPIAMENFCEEDGLSDNLSCEKEDGSRECFARSELCNKSPFCKDGLDEGMSQIGLDCDGSLTGRKLEPGFLCSNGTILGITQMCDGTADCGSGEDETNLLCANKCQGPYYGGCSYTRECESTPEGATCGNCLPGYARNPNDYTIGRCLMATFRFQPSSYSVCEGSSRTVYVQLQTEGVLDQAVRVTVRTVSSGTATAGVDYTEVSEEVVFSPFNGGGTIRPFTVSTRSDSTTEGTETFQVEASAGNWPFTQNTTTVTINECSTSRQYLVFVGFSSAREDAGVVTTYITLNSNVGTLQEDVVVDVSTSDYGGSFRYYASENIDYIETSATLTFPMGTGGGARLPFNVSVIDDNIAEYYEDFRVTASVQGSGFGFYTRMSHSSSVRIYDNDPFRVTFEHANYTVMEGGAVEVCVVSVTNPDRVHVYSVQLFTFTDCDNNTADATADMDYAGEYGRTQLIFSPVSYRECTIIQTYHDEVDEPIEKFRVRAGTQGGLGRFQSPFVVDVFIINVQVDLVTVSIEEPSYTITMSESTVEVCVTADKALDQPVNASLQSSNEIRYVTLTSGILRSCTIFSFPEFLLTNNQADNIRAIVVSGNRRVNLGRSISEVIPQTNEEQCPRLVNPLNGQVDESLSDGQIQQGSVATYSCDVGYVPDGRRFRECLKDFTWSGSPTQCILDSPSKLSSSTNELILGFLSTSPFLIATTDDSQLVFYTANRDTSAFAASVRSNTYSQSGTSQASKVHVKVEEVKKISVFGWEQIYSPSYSYDSFLAFSTISIGEMDDYEYYSLPFSNPSSLLIVASKDDTIITLPSSSLMLDRFQTHRIDNIRSLSSLRVTSNKPISVTSAKSCLGRVSNCDFLVEQVLPTHLWGKTFLVASFSGLKTGETIRIIFSKLSTSVTVTCAESNFFYSTIGRGPGQWVDVELDERGRDRFCIIEATDPVYVVQYARESDGESYMMTIPSIDHYGGFFQGFYTRNYNNPFEFVTIYVTPEYFVPGVEGVSVDGVPVLDWKVVRCRDGSACGYIARPLLRRRRYYHTVVHTNPRARIGVSAYGYDIGRSSSFGYPVSLQMPPDQNTDECLPQLDICSSNAECLMNNGRYMCVCNPGYQRVGQTLLCIDMDECEQSSFSCDLNAQCTNTVGSFTCTCNQGFTGTGRQCTRNSSLIQFKDYIPFIDLDLAKKTSGSFNNLADDECKPVRLNLFVPIGGTKISEISLCDNGIISLGDRPFKIWSPQLFPSDNPLISQSNILAIFWNDHQPALSSSSISYQIFEKGGADEVKNVSSFLSEQLVSKFEGDWMIAISWEEVTPFLQQQSGTISKNSYQAVIITDFKNTYVIFTYDDNRLEWIGTGAQRNVYSVVGYNLDQRVAGSLNNIPSFQNHRLSGTSDVDGISKLNRGNDVQWANLIYHIGSDIVTGQQSFAECKSMESQDINLFENLGVRLEQGLACPCSINQAFRDRRYVHASGHLAGISGDSRFNSRNCFVQVFRPLASNRGVHMCCYSTSEETFGALLDTTFGTEASSSLRFHPYSEPDQYVEFDYHFYESCCLYPGGECKVYTDQRKADDCGAYTPSSFAWAWGDPHITTLDGLEYTFNGWGEYTLMEINTPDALFLLQGRTHPVADSNATQFIGFAFGSSANDTVEVQLSEDNSHIVVLLRGSDITGNVSNTDDIFFSPNQDVFITRDSQSSLTCSFPIGISVTVSLSSEMLSFVVEIPDQFQNITQGLMGNNNGIGTDDVVYRNGTMLAYDASDRQIHEFGQSWQITPEESLFTYPEGTSAEDYAHPDHVPEFLDEVVSTATVDILTACGDSVQCIYDASQTGDINIGLETMVTNEANIVYHQEAINMPPVIVGPPTLLVTLGEEAELVFTVTDDNNLFNVSVVGGLPVNSTLTSTPQDGFMSYTFSWTIFEIVDVSLMFEARDERNAVSVLSVQVQICACQNGGECTLDGLLSSSDRTVVLNCNCPEAYDGRFCAEDYDGCSDIICFTEVACVDQPAPGIGAMCGPCPDGYFGDGEKCIDIDECEDDSHDCSDLCVNNDGGFECDCSPGYTLINSTDCADVDECAVLNGDCHQVCNNFDGGFSCSCNEGFELTSDNRTCQVLPESSCGQETICTQNCVRLSGVEVCSCDPGYQLADDGANCLDIDECMESPCDQMCTNQEGGFQCSCRAGYELEMDGRTCQDIDECSLAAQNNTDLCTPPMICSNTAGGFECLCPAGTEAAGGTCIPIGINVRRVNDSVIGDPLMTVPLYLTNTSALDHVELSEDEVVNLCFEIHGRADKYFNLVSDSCVSVNAHYVRAHRLLGYNIINEITVRAVGLDGTCRNIAVRVSGCQAFIDGTVLNGTFSSAGVSIRTYSNRVRISLPNCQDLDLVMWVFCERNELRGFPEQGEPDVNVGVDLLRFVIARGYNIRETAHGLLGQFWNIPIDIERYTGALSDGSTRDDTYILTVSYPDSPPRRFLTFLHSPTWDRRGKEYCLYGGNRQGGGIQELRSPNDPIIEGKYREYIMSGPFDVDFVYAHFESSECN